MDTDDEDRSLSIVVLYQVLSIHEAIPFLTIQVLNDPKEPASWDRKWANPVRVASPFKGVARNVSM